MQSSTAYKIQAKFLLALFLLFFLICCVCASAQSTTASATVVDQKGVTWANGTWELQFNPNPNYGSNTVYWNGVVFPTSQWVYSGNLDNTGSFSQSVPSNNFITPTGSTYTLTVCPNATAPCSVLKKLTLQGTSLDLSSTITNATPGLSVKPLPLARAYSDAEVQVDPSLVGYFYLRVTDNQPRYWGQDQQWHNFVTGVETFTVGNLPPLFNASIGSDPQNPQLQFTQQMVAALTVYANCNGSTANPTFCAISANMLPPSINSNTSGSAGSLSGSLNQCSNSPTQLFSVGITSTGNANCTQVLFPAVGGNISTNQMNGGTNADASHVWAGGNSNNGQWIPFSTITSGHNYYFNYTGCTITNGSNLGNCANSETWSGLGLSSATVVSTDYLGCTVQTGNTYTASWSLSTFSSSGFTAYWTEIMANSDSSATPTIKCYLHTAA